LQINAVASSSKELIVNSIGIELNGIEPGTFTMGEGSDGVAVTLTNSFWLGRAEVTQGQFKTVMGTKPWEGKDFVQSDKDCPSTSVSWDDVTKFFQKLTEYERKAGTLKAVEEYRLPTEAEWEYACRAGTTTTYSFGDDKSNLGEYAWFDGNAFDAGEKYAHKVGSKKPNLWGLHDMHGNLFEWCTDWTGSLRVNRGGGWRRDPGFCRSAPRSGNAPSDRLSDLGFRLARSQSVK